MTSDDRLLTVGTVARELQVSLDTVRRWIRTEKLPARRVCDGWYRITVADLRVLQEKLQKPHKPQVT